MSHSTLFVTNETSTPNSNDSRFHCGSISTTSQSNATLPIDVQTSVVKPTLRSNPQTNPKLIRNLRDKRRSTGILPDEVTAASLSIEDSTSEDHGNEKYSLVNRIAEPNESYDKNETILCSNYAKATITVNRIQSSFENIYSAEKVNSYASSNNPLSITTKILKSEEYIPRQTGKSTLSSHFEGSQYQQLEERIFKLESVVHEKDIIIDDLQRQLDRMTRDFADAEKRIRDLHQEKLTLIKAFTTLHDKSSISEDLFVF